MMSSAMEGTARWIIGTGPGFCENLRECSLTWPQSDKGPNLQDRALTYPTGAAAPRFHLPRLLASGPVLREPLLSALEGHLHAVASSDRSRS
jgi:hypothetical protein